MFAFKEVSPEDIPNNSSHRTGTDRSKWSKELIEAFVDSGARAWEVCEGINGPFKTMKDVDTCASSIRTQAKKFKGVSCLQRGKQLFLLKDEPTKSED